ncbi:glutamyl-tRNA reductase [Alicyclobacillus cycloheptanicus]|uniref:Glutamyl-tRNA reductase n=1 Tax=Alicyclobacillus cycloheptanicus TaxID=1457 RepID=A0ABT9XDA9_9BACL|nr:glutamyl-tRNA reductase [Alicyclobacillus cycloheptanicus]MDQ0188288.1 glutamyl-tRNA reductase [Alicyclobacillus cycloheptanicus]WDM01006.1 glutamyl-tRNA reductase [Alicyclobacillus cycloheptanicus]
MQLMMVGMNHRTAPVELRERVAIAEADLEPIYLQFSQSRTLFESVVLSTCNRTELYVVGASVQSVRDYLQKFLARRAGMSEEAMLPHVMWLQGEAVVRHLMRVASGLDSMVVGETQILGQVRDAFRVASECGATGLILNQLMRTAIHLGKRAHTETAIGQNAVSVSYAAVQLAKKVFGDLHGRQVLVVGAGKMGRLTTQHLHANGIGALRVVNRSLERAEQLAEEFGGTAIEWSALAGALATADIVISSTGAPGLVITKEQVEAAVRGRGGRPLVLIDIAVPRDIDPAAAHTSHVFLYDIDDLEGVVAANQAERAREAETVGRMIDETFASFVAWLAEQRVVPVISAIREKGAEIQASVMASLERKLPELSERERKLIRKHAMSIVNQLLRDPIRNMKEIATAQGGADAVQLFAQLFGVSEEALADPAVDMLLDSAVAEPGLSAQAWERREAEGQRAAGLRNAPLHPALR